MSKEWTKLKSWGRHERHNELVKASFHVEPNKGENILSGHGFFLMEKKNIHYPSK